MHIVCVSDVVNYMYIHFKFIIIISIVQAKNVGVANEILIRVILPPVSTSDSDSVVICVFHFTIKLCSVHLLRQDYICASRAQLNSYIREKNHQFM
jgi:hypothetical protein